MTLSDMLRQLYERRREQEQQQLRAKQRVAAARALREQTQRTTQLPLVAE